MNKNNNTFGVLACGYDCAEHLEKVISPWLIMKRDFPEIFTFSCISALFKEYADCGQQFDNKLVEPIKTTGLFDYLFVSENKTEAEARNIALQPLKKCDYIWLLDLQDEIYRPQEIIDIMSFVNKRPFISWFKINFRNYFRDEKTWISGFCPPRIFSNKLNGGIKGFYFDNDIEYNNGINYKMLSSSTIPINTANVQHFSWCGTDKRLKEKVNYHMNHFKHCSYKWDDEKGLMIDYEYYKKYNLPPPEIHHDV